MDKVHLPEHWSKWIVQKEIGAGAYGTVYLAGTKEDEISAIKIIHIPREDAEAAALYREYRSVQEVSRYYSDMVSGMVDEIQTLMSLKGCNNIVQIQDYHVEKRSGDEYGWDIYIRMEYLQSLTAYLHTHDPDEAEIVRMGIDLCVALEECQKAGFIHRDIKPDNILISEEGEFKLGDFGVARKLSGSPLSLTMKGTFSYMSPEIYFGKIYDQTSDIYSLGLVLYRMMNRNREPFLDVEKQIINPLDREKAMGERMRGRPVPPPAFASEEMARIIQKACAFLPEDRYPDASSMKKDLLMLRDGFYKKTEEMTGNPEDGESRTGLERPGEVEGRARSEKHEEGENGVEAKRPEEEGSRVKEEKPEEEGSRVKEEKPEEEESRTKPEKPEEGKSAIGSGEPAHKRKPGAGLLIAGLILLAGLLGAMAYHLTSNHTGTYFQNQSCSPDGDLTATLYKDGLLKISGNGSLGPAAPYGPLPWEDYRDNIKKIEAEKGLVSLEESVFADCSNLSEADLPEGILTIGESAFEECGQLKTLEIPSTVEEIGDRAFYHTKWLQLQEDQGDYVTVNGILLQYSGQSEEAVLPEDIRVINDRAFERNPYLREVTLPEGLQEIGYAAFRDCERLSRIQGLEDTERTEEIEIGGEAFKDTPWMDSQLAKGKGLAVLGSRVLAWQGYDKKLKIPDDIETIGGCAFGENEYLEEVILPAGLKNIDPQAFYGCTRLKKVVFEGEGIKEIPYQTFLDCSSLSEISLPDSLEVIGEEAFSGCVSLRKVRLSVKLKEIGRDAFRSCVNLEEVEQASGLDRKMLREAFIDTFWYDNIYE